MKIFFYDTETTGLPIWKEPSDDPAQPHLVQLGCAVVDSETLQVEQSLDVIIRPDGWTIPQEVTDVHGISTERAAAEGVGEENAVAMFLDMHGICDMRVAHNEQFDARIMRIALKRYFPGMADTWKEGSSYCTARKATKIVAIPPTDRMRAAGRFHHKTPSLMECYEHFFGHCFENAHSAMADVLACIEVYREIQKQDAV